MEKSISSREISSRVKAAFLEVDMIVINDLSWNKISFSRKGERVEVVRKLGRKTIFKNRDGVKFSVANSLVGLYFCHEAVTDQGGSKIG
jgi:hypothetical protein